VDPEPLMGSRSKLSVAVGHGLHLWSDTSADLRRFVWWRIDLMRDVLDRSTYYVARASFWLLGHLTTLNCEDHGVGAYGCVKIHAYM
jgi:hypothetical protein